MSVRFEWHVLESASAVRGPQLPPRRALGRWRLFLFVGLAALALAGAVAWRASQGTRAARVDIEHRVWQEVLALQAGQRELFLALLDDSSVPWRRYHEDSFYREAAWYGARARARPRVERITLGADRAAAEVILSDGTQAWQATWYYRYADGQWRHTEPPAEYWGPGEPVAAPHVTLVTHAPDRTLAARLVGELEALYLKLAETYRLGGPAPDAAPSPGSIVLHVVPYRVGSAGSDYQWSLSLPSPRLGLEMWTPEEHRASLARAARTAVARVLLGRALKRANHPTDSLWLVEGLALWHAGAWEPEWRRHIQASLADGSYRQVFDPPHESDAHQQPVRPERDRALAYALGEFLGMTCPPGQLCSLLRAAGTSSPQEAMAQALGQSGENLEAAWATHLARLVQRLTYSPPASII